MLQRLINSLHYDLKQDISDPSSLQVFDATWLNACTYHDNHVMSLVMAPPKKEKKYPNPKAPRNRKHKNKYNNIKCYTSDAYTHTHLLEKSRKNEVIYDNNQNDVFLLFFFQNPLNFLFLFLNPSVSHPKTNVQVKIFNIL